MRFVLNRCGAMSRSQASALFQLLSDDVSKDEALALTEPWRGMAVRLLGVDQKDRRTVWNWLVDGLADHEKIVFLNALDRIQGARTRLEEIRDPLRKSRPGSGAADDPSTRGEQE